MFQALQLGCQSVEVAATAAPTNIVWLCTNRKYKLVTVPFPVKMLLKNAMKLKTMLENWNKLRNWVEKKLRAFSPGN